MFTPLAILIWLFFVLVFLRIEIGFALLLTSLVVLLQLDLPLESLANQILQGIDNFPLLAVPLFLLLGRIVEAGGITDRLLAVANAVIGRLRGALGHANVVSSMGFGAISGSAVSDVVSIGAMMIPAMKKAGYPAGYAAAITACSAILGVVIPPSIVMIIYGAVGQVSVGALLIAGIVPGVTIGLAQMGYNHLLAVRNDWPRGAPMRLRARGEAVVHGLPVLFIPVLVLGGVTGGFVTPTEAAIVAVLWAALLAIGAYGAIRLRDVPNMLGESAVAFSIPMFIVGASGIYGWLVAYLGAGPAVASFLLGITDSYWGLMLLLVAFLIVIGIPLNPIPSVLIFLPVIQAVGDAAGAHPIQVGVITVIVLAIGLLTPPLSICLLIAAQIAEVQELHAFRHALPIIGVCLLVVLLLIAVPEIVLFLPRLAFPEVFLGG